MSRTRTVAETAQNPSTLAIFYNGNTGQFGYPKEGDDAGFENLAELPKLMLLDGDTFSVTGHTGNDERITSNIAHRGYNSNLSVKIKENGAEIANGGWKDIKPTLGKGAKYTGNIFFLTEKGHIVTLFLKGRALAAWYKFVDGYRDHINTIWVTTKGRTQEAGGAGRVASQVPNFVLAAQATPEQINLADEKDRELQAYFATYFESKTNGAEPVAPQPVAPQPVAQDAPVANFAGASQVTPPSAPEPGEFPTMADAPPLQIDDMLPF